ncbi:hypothetical protein [Caedibacter taeniospiralis]|jgi:hypothetical protein
MKSLLTKYRVDQFIEENQVSEEDLKAMLDLIGREGFLKNGEFSVYL